MDWIVCTVAEVDSLLGPREREAIRQHLGDDYGVEYLDAAVSEVRGYCAARGGLGPEGSIPPECRRALRRLYCYSLLSALPVGALMTDARQREYDTALAFLRDVGRGVVGITRPSPPTTGPEALTGSAPASPSICAPRRQRGRRELDGS